MSYNYSWVQQGYKDYYLPSDVIQKDPTILYHLNEICTAVITQDRRKIYILKDTPLPDYIKPTFEHANEYDFEIFKRVVEKINIDNNFPIINLPANIFKQSANFAEKKFNAAALVNAARKGDLKLLKQAKDYSESWDTNDIAKEAARSGQLEVIQWLAENDTAVFENNTFKLKLAELAAGNNHVELFNWLVDRIPHRMGSESEEGSLNSICNIALESKNFQLVDNLILKLADEVYNLHHSQKSEVTRNMVKESVSDFMLDQAASNGKVEVIKHLIDAGVPWNINYSTSAASNGHINVLDWAYKVNSNYISLPDVFKSVMKGGDIKNTLQILNWLRNYNYPIDPILFYSKSIISVELLQWGKQNNIPFPTKDDMTKFVYEAHLLQSPKAVEVLEWLRQNNLLNFKSLVLSLISVELLDWALLHGIIDKNEELDGINQLALASGNHKVLEWIANFKRTYSKEKAL
jgi:hypothetical protein